jgi:hypothetical protein
VTAPGSNDDVQLIVVEDHGQQPTTVYVPGGSDLGPITSRVSAVETEVDAHHIRLQTLEDSDDEQDDRLAALEVASGDPDAVQDLIDTSLDAHIQDARPHPVYDDLPSLSLIFENGLI